MNFFRAPHVKKRKDGDPSEPFGWENNDPALCKRLEGYCFEQFEKLVRLLRPRAFLVLGADAAFDKLNVTYADRPLLRTSNHHSPEVLLRLGDYRGTPVINLRHPSSQGFLASDREHGLRVGLREAGVLKGGQR